jgi:beta-carotene 3-hydroxylase
MWINIIAFLVGFVGMEGVAWLTHRYVMHGFLWSLHQSHHQKSRGFFEKNDSYFLMFAILGCIFIYTGAVHGFDWRLGIGLGITGYGFTYLVVHDIIIHQRVRWFTKLNHPYFNALRRAHRDHHANVDKDAAVSYGMLVVSRKYFIKK